MELVGVTTFPCVAWDEERGDVVATPNLETIVAARDTLRAAGFAVPVLNAPGVTCVATLDLVAAAGATHVEPGSALIGETPWHAANDANERPAMVYVTEVTHELDGRAYTLGGGFYARSRMRSALVFGDGDPVEAAVVELPAAEIDYYGALQSAGGRARARSAPPSSTRSARRRSSAALRSRSWPASSRTTRRCSGSSRATGRRWGMTTVPLTQWTVAEATEAQFRLVDAFHREFDGYEALEAGDYGAPADLGRSRMTAKVERVLAAFFGAEDVVLTPGAGTGALRSALMASLRVGRLGAGARLPGLRHHRRHVPGHGLQVATCDFNDAAAARARRSPARPDMLYVQHARQRLDDGYSTAEVIAAARADRAGDGSCWSTTTTPRSPCRRSARSSAPTSRPSRCSSCSASRASGCVVGAAAPDRPDPRRTTTPAAPRSTGRSRSRR